MSTELLPIKPGHTSGVNSGSYEQLRYDFLNRFINYPNMFSVCLTIRDYLNSSLSGPNAYTYDWVSKVWKKDGVLWQIGAPQLYILVCNFEAVSFCRDVVCVLLDDIKHNKETQKAIYDNVANDEATRMAAWSSYENFRSMENNLRTYKNDFLTYPVISGEILPTLEVLMHIAS